MVLKTELSFLIILTLRTYLATFVFQVSKHKTLKMEINKDLKEPMKYNEHKFGSFISKRL